MLQNRTWCLLFFSLFVILLTRTWALCFDADTSFCFYVDSVLLYHDLAWICLRACERLHFGLMFIIIYELVNGLDPLWFTRVVWHWAYIWVGLTLIYQIGSSKRERERERLPSQWMGPNYHGEFLWICLFVQLYSFR
jgi:hypothetical protein